MTQELLHKFPSLFVPDKFVQYWFVGVTLIPGKELSKT